MQVIYATGKNRAAHTRSVAKSRAEQAQKSGEHGTLRKFRIVYRDPDPSSPDFSGVVWRYDLEHLLDSWDESLDGDDWQIVRIEALK